MPTLFRKPTYIPNYDSKTYNAGFNEKNMVDIWARPADKSPENSIVSVNGVQIYKKLNCAGNTFETNPKRVVQNLLNQNQTKLDEAIIDHIFAYGNFDGFMGMLAPLISAEMKQVDPTLFYEFKLLPRYEFVTDSRQSTVKYSECVDVCRDREKIMTFRCDSLISAKDGIVAHVVTGGKIITYNDRHARRLFGCASPKALVVRIINKIKELLSHLFQKSILQNKV